MTKKTQDVDDFLNEEATTITEIPSKKAPWSKPVAPAGKKYIYTKNSKLGKNSSLVSINISEKMLPPITKRRQAVYELLTISAVDSRIVSGPGNGPQPYQLASKYKITDYDEPDLAKRTKWIVYSNEVRAWEYWNAIERKGDEPQLDIPEFINGQLSLDCEANYMKYVSMELNPQNETNKYRDKTKKPIFKRVDIEYTSPHQQLLRMDLARDAENYIIGLDPNKLVDLATAFGIPTHGMSASHLKVDLRIRARNNPQEVLFKAPDKKGSLIANIFNAINLGILEYIPESQEYAFDINKPFFQVPLDQNSMESLADFMLTEEGTGAKEELDDALGFWK